MAELVKGVNTPWDYGRDVDDATIPEMSISRDRMAADEMEALRKLRVYLDCYVSFPSAHNASLITSQMTVYQGAWMNGRERVPKD
jgi:hypothetical protein